jgi:EmrB/QacA subfamily drug resistance transporter
MSEVTKRKTATWGILLGLLLAALDGTLVATVLPRILLELSGFELYYLPNSAFMLCQTISTPLWGRLSDVHGRGRFHLAAVIVLMLGSVLCGLSTSMAGLCASRAVQGLGAGGLFALSFTMVADLFELEKRAKMQGAISSVWGVAAIAGPFAGEWITEFWGWRGVFWLNVPVGLLSIALVQTSWPKKAVEALRGKTDFLGAALLALASAALLGYFGLAGRAGWNDPRALGAAGVAVLLLAALVAVERRSPDPFLAYDLFRNRLFAAGALTGMCAMTCMFDAILHVPLLVVGLLDGQLKTGGLMLTVMMIPWMACSGATKPLLARFSYRGLASVGMLFCATSYLLLRRVGTSTTLFHVAGAMLLLGTGLGLTVAPLLIGAQNAIPKAQLGAATSLTQFTRSMGAGLGLAVMGSLFIAAFGGREPEALARFRQTQDPAVIKAVRGELAQALRDVFTAGFVAAALGFVIAGAIPKGKAADLKRDPEQDPEQVVRPR